MSLDKPIDLRLDLEHLLQELSRDYITHTDATCFSRQDKILTRFYLALMAVSAFEDKRDFKV